jgi:hypothetical protein
MYEVFLSSYDWTSDLEARSLHVRSVCIEPVTAGLHRQNRRKANELSMEKTDTSDRSVSFHVFKVYTPKLDGTYVMFVTEECDTDHASGWAGRSHIVAMFMTGNSFIPVKNTLDCGQSCLVQAS